MPDLSEETREMQRRLALQWEDVDRRYRFLIALWLSAFVATGSVSVYEIAKFGPSISAAILAFVSGFQLASFISSIEHKKMLILTRSLTVGFNATIEQALQTLAIMAERRDRE